LTKSRVFTLTVLMETFIGQMIQFLDVHMEFMMRTDKNHTQEVVCTCFVARVLLHVFCCTCFVARVLLHVFLCTCFVANAKNLDFVTGRLQKGTTRLSLLQVSALLRWLNVLFGKYIGQQPGSGGSETSEDYLNSITVLIFLMGWWNFDFCSRTSTFF